MMAFRCLRCGNAGRLPGDGWVDESTGARRLSVQEIDGCHACETVKVAPAALDDLNRPALVPFVPSAHRPG